MLSKSLVSLRVFKTFQSIKGTNSESLEKGIHLLLKKTWTKSSMSHGYENIFLYCCHVVFFLWGIWNQTSLFDRILSLSQFLKKKYLSSFYLVSVHKNRCDISFKKSNNDQHDFKYDSVYERCFNVVREGENIIGFTFFNHSQYQHMWQTTPFESIFPK